MLATMVATSLVAGGIEMHKSEIQQSFEAYREYTTSTKLENKK